VKTINVKCFLSALNRAIDFQRKQPMNGVEVVIALTEVRDALKYAIDDKKTATKRKAK